MPPGTPGPVVGAGVAVGAGVGVAVRSGVAVGACVGASVWACVGAAVVATATAVALGLSVALALGLGAADVGAAVVAAGVGDGVCCALNAAKLAWACCCSSAVRHCGSLPAWEAAAARSAPRATASFTCWILASEQRSGWSFAKLLLQAVVAMSRAAMARPRYRCIRRTLPFPMLGWARLTPVLVAV